MSVSSWSTCERGQVSPIAALLAVVVLAAALTLYGTALLKLLPGQEERSVEDRTLSNVWEQIRDSGVYEDGTLSGSGAVDRRVLPEGYNVYINVTRIRDDGTRTEVDELVYDADPSTGTIVMDPPQEATLVSRPIPVRESPGSVVGGTLHVAVWQSE